MVPVHRNPIPQVMDQRFGCHCWICVCSGVNQRRVVELVGRNIWSPSGPSVAQLRIDWVVWGLPHSAPAPASHAPPSEFFFTYNWPELAHLVTCLLLVVCFHCACFPENKAVVSAVSGGFQKVLQPPGGLCLAGCGHWETPEWGLNRRGCRGSWTPGAVPCQEGVEHSQNTWAKLPSRHKVYLYQQTWKFGELLLRFWLCSAPHKLGWTVLLSQSCVKDPGWYKHKDHPEGVTFNSGYWVFFHSPTFILSLGQSKKSVCSAFGRENKGVILLLSTADGWEFLEQTEPESFRKCRGKKLRQQTANPRIFQLDTRAFHHVSGQSKVSQGLGNLWLRTGWGLSWAPWSA